MTRLSLLILAEYAPLAHLLFILVKFVSCSQFGRGVQQFQFRLWNLHLCQFAQDVCSLDRSDKMTGEWVVISSCVSNLLAVAKLFLKSLVRDFPLILKLHTHVLSEIATSMCHSPELSFLCAPGPSAALSSASLSEAFWWTQVSPRLSSSLLCWLGGPKRCSHLHLLVCPHLMKTKSRDYFKAKSNRQHIKTAIT